jgi:hypothetical protein
MYRSLWVARGVENAATSYKLLYREKKTDTIPFAFDSFFGGKE